MPRLHRTAVVQLILVLAAAVALKQFYSTASANELKWMLWPTARLTTLVTGVSFSFESFAGYMSSDHTFLIAAPCAGVNFLIAAFLMVLVSEVWRQRSTGLKWRMLPLAAVTVYVVTLFANAARISCALWLHDGKAAAGLVSPGEAHRLDGIIIYFGFLLLLFVACELKAGQKLSRKKVLLPLAAYYCITLAVPLANGAAGQGLTFWRHAAFVVLVPVFLVLPLFLFIRTQKRQTEREDVSAPRAFTPVRSPADEVCP